MERELEEPECSFCGSVVKRVTKTSAHYYDGREEEIELCDVCYDSHAGVVANYPMQPRDATDVLKFAAWATNRILEAIEAWGRNRRADTL